MRWLHFILSHSIFISICSAALCFQTFQLLHIPPNNFIYGLVFFATLSSYNYYWLISKYDFKNSHHSLPGFFIKNLSNVFIFVVAALGLFYCLYFLPAVLPEILIAVILTLLYSLPLFPVRKFAFIRQAGFLKTFLLAFTWTYVTVMIPVQEAGSVSNFSICLLFTARFLFMLMLCIIFDSRDISIDKLRSLRTLATDVSRHTLRLIITIDFICYLAAGFLLRIYFNDMAQVIAFFITGVLTMIVYRLSLKKQGYFFYYFLVDGLMLFSAAATYVASI